MPDTGGHRGPGPGSVERPSPLEVCSRGEMHDLGSCRSTERWTRRWFEGRHRRSRRLPTPATAGCGRGRGCCPEGFSARVDQDLSAVCGNSQSLRSTRTTTRAFGSAASNWSSTGEPGLPTGDAASPSFAAEARRDRNKRSSPPLELKWFAGQRDGRPWFCTTTSTAARSPAHLGRPADR